MSGTGSADWVVVVPVKRLEVAKTRLDRADRRELALAMAVDTVTAAGRCPRVTRVVVVTDDRRAARELAGLAEVVADSPDDGLNPALRYGETAARTLRPGCGVAALAADLPAMKPEELARALDGIPASSRAMVADAQGGGTVLLAAAPGADLEPRFGPGSRATHVASGVVDLTDRLGDAVPGLRRDVDTTADLVDARTLGVGRAVAGAVGGTLGAPRDRAGWQTPEQTSPTTRGSTP